ncbi:conserved hypothetical protein [Desulfovibrionales bacterium]
MDIIIELWNNIFYSNTASTVGVIGVWLYMLVLVITALYRINKGDHMR